MATREGEIMFCNVMVGFFLGVMLAGCGLCCWSILRGTPETSWWFMTLLDFVWACLGAVGYWRTSRMFRFLVATYRLEQIVDGMLLSKNRKSEHVNWIQEGF